MKKNPVIIVISFFLIILVFLLVSDKIKNEDILGTETEVTIEAQVYSESVNYKLYPEKRVPSTNNWANTYKISVEDCSTSQLYTFPDSTSNNLGDGDISFSEANPTHTYRFIFQGKSHLRFKSDCYPINKVVQVIDFTSEISGLYAGEISTDYDNYINSLDLSYQITKMNTADDKADLNHDGIVNSLDLSILINNLFLSGE